MFGHKKRKHKKLRAKPFPDQWRQLLTKNLSYIDRLTAADRKELEGLINIFLDEKRFEGCDGLVITDEIRVTIAAQACILMLNRPSASLYRSLKTIYVYPGAFITPGRNPDGTLTDKAHVTLGQSWIKGPVVVSWKHALDGAASATDGHNVVYHEFAHQLDAEDGATNGAPILNRASMYAAWSNVLANEYHELRADLHNNHKNLLGAYAATNPAEFFAVATERFFERPKDLQRQSPDLYQQLKEFYKQDPAQRFNRKD